MKEIIQGFYQKKHFWTRLILVIAAAVSYTHLDVYKRQDGGRPTYNRGTYRKTQRAF